MGNIYAANNTGKVFCLRDQHKEDLLCYYLRPGLRELQRVQVVVKLVWNELAAPTSFFLNQEKIHSMRLLYVQALALHLNLPRS